MKPILSRISLAVFVFCVLSAHAQAQDVKARDLVLTQLWARATPSGTKVGAAYLTIENNGSVLDRLVSLSTSLGKAQLHEMKTVDGVMTMRPIEGGLTIAPGQKVTLAPGGIHLMLTDLNASLKDGEMLHVILQFEKAGQIDAGFHIRPVGAQGPDGGPAKPGAADKSGSDPHSGMKM